MTPGPAERPRGRLRVLNQFYPPDVAPTGQLVADVAEAAARAGWDVEVICGTAPYDGSRAGGTRRPARSRGRRAGVRVLRLRTSRAGAGLASKAAAYAVFLLRALVHALRWRRGDVVLALTTPPLVGLLGRLAQRRGARFVLKLEDLYPDVALALGALRPGPVTRLLARLSTHLLRKADGIVTLSPAMQAVVEERRGSRSGLHLIPNWGDDPERVLRVEDSRARATLKLAPGTLLLGYAGNSGRAHRFDALLDGLREARARGLPLHLHLTGAGAQLGTLRAAAASLPYVTLGPYVPRAQVPDLLAAADVQVVAQRDEVEGLLHPSKLMAAFAAGRPVLALGPVDGDVATQVREARAGWVAPHDPARVAEALATIVAERSSLGEVGRRARAYYERHGTRATAVARWLDVLDRQRGVPRGVDEDRGR